MTFTQSFALQKALFSTITSDPYLQGLGVSCYDRVSDTGFPYVTIGEDALTEMDYDCGILNQITSTVRVYSRSPGKGEAKEIAGILQRILTKRFGFDMNEGDSFKVVSGHCDGFSVNRHEDGLTTQIELTFVYMIADTVLLGRLDSALGALTVSSVAENVLSGISAEALGDMTVEALAELLITGGVAATLEGLSGDLQAEAGGLLGLFATLLTNEELAGNDNVFYNPSDLTSLRVETNGSGGSPAVGDPVGMMLDTSGLSGSMEEFLGGQTELVTNGTFDTDTTGWTAASDATLSSVSGELHVTCTAPDTLALAYQTFSTVVGKWYEGTITKVSQDVSSAWGFSTTLAGPRDLASFTNADTGTATAIFQATTTTSYVQLWGFSDGVSDGTTVYDNVSVKEIPGNHAIAPSDAARPTLMDDPDTTWSSLTDDGTRGDELVTNGTFDTDTSGWTLNNSAILAQNNGQLVVENGAASFGFAYQLLETEIGATYELTADVIADPDTGASTAVFRIGSGTTGGNGSTTSDYASTPSTGTSVQAQFTATRTDNYIRFGNNNTTVGSKIRLDNISVRKVNTTFDERGSELVTNGTFDGGDITGWTENTGFTLSADNGGLKAEYDGATGLWYVGASQAVTTEAGEWYEVTFDITALDNNLGRIRVETALGNAAELNATAMPVGSHRYRFYASSTTTYLNFSVHDNAAGSATYDNISCRKIPYRNLLLIDTNVPADQDDDTTFDTDTGNWSKGSGWSIGSGVASCDGTQTGNSNLAKSAGFVSNKWYRVRMHITSLSAGGVYINIGGATSSPLYTTTGWVEFIGRAITNVNIYIQATTTFVGSIDNVIVQELPSTTPTSYYLDCDGTDDWMQVTPTLNLGEQWWHTGAWQADASLDRPFATSSDYRGAPIYQSSGWRWYDPSSVAQEIVSLDPANKHVLTIEQADTNSISGRGDGANSAGTITPYNDSGATQGLALFSHNNILFGAGWNGRFYGGAWGQGQVDYDELTTLQDYLGTLVEPDIDPTDVTSYANVYEMLSAQTAAALFDIDDTTSLRVERDGSGGVPVDGDPVGMMMDVSGAGGGTMAAYLAGATELASPEGIAGAGAVPTEVNGVWTISRNSAGTTNQHVRALDSASGWYEVKFTVADDATEAGNTAQIRDGGGTIVSGQYSDEEVVFVYNFSTSISIFPLGPSHSVKISNISVKALPGYVATAPSDAARPTLASVLDETASELTDDGTRGLEEAETDLTQWLTSGSPTVTDVAVGYRITRGASINPVVYYQMTLTPGEEYEFSYEFLGESGNSNERGDVRIGTSVGGVDIYRQAVLENGQEGTYTTKFKATAATIYVSIYLVGGSDGDWVEFDNISVKKVQTVFDGRGPLIPITNDPATGNNGDGTWSLTVGQSVRFLVDLVDLEDGAVYEIEVDVTELTGNGSSDFCDINPTPLAVGTVRYQATRSTYNGTYRFIDVSAGGGGSTTTFSTPRIRKVLTPNLLLTSAGDDDSTFDADTGNWTKGTGWSIGSGVATFTANASNSALQITLTPSGNRWHRLRYYVSANTLNAGDLRFGGFSGSTIRGEGQVTLTQTVGWHEHIFRSSASGGVVDLWVTSAATTGAITIDNVIVQEVPASVARAHYLDFDGVDDNLILDGTDFGSSTNATLYKTFRGDSTDTEQIMFGTNTGDFILAAQNSGSTVLSDASVGSPVYREDGVIPAYVDRNDIFTALIDGTDHTIGVEEADLSGDATWTSSGFYIGGEHTSTWDSTGRLYAWAAVDTRLDGRNRDLLENWFLSKKTT